MPYLCGLWRFANAYFIWNEREVIWVQIDKLQLLILSILTDSNATAPGVGMTLREIASAVNDSEDHTYAQITINRKVWAMREPKYVDAKMKSNKADLFYITEKGMELKEVLLGEKRNAEK